MAAAARQCTEVEEDLLCIQQRREKVESLRQQELEQLHKDAAQREQELESKGAQLQQSYARKQQEVHALQRQIKELDEHQSSMMIMGGSIYAYGMMILALLV
ncbi:hypothetical protein JKP88DRAFT_282660 [Tribonema minus]|uniref:Uncharacterized protein n=1 Tax=Tribonema minus TaxID=303371 RepID=A0A835YN59_9STRA|nr:hypothetical protein JKP88DRAFT_282660 [Tribonema minus]